MSSLTPNSADAEPSGVGHSGTASHPDPDPGPGSRRGPRPRGDRSLGWILGLVAFGVSVSGSWIPSLWGDEAASILSAQRPLPSLFRMLGHVDAVHGTYYLGLHAWIEVFGSSPFAVRFPSAVAAGLVATGLYFVARDLGSRRVAVVAALVVGILPRTVSFGDEARSYAIGTAIATWLIFLLCRLVAKKTPSFLWWVGYAVALTAGTYVFLYFLLLIAVHAVVLLQARAVRGLWVRWAVASGAAVVASLPVTLWTVSERDQIAFLATRDSVTPTSILVTTWFGSVPVATVAWTLMALAVVLPFGGRALQGWRNRRRGATGETGSASRSANPRRELRIFVAGRARPVASLISPTVLALAWLLVPLGLLVAANLAVAIFTPRYLSFSIPAAALLIALGIERLALLISRLVGDLRRGSPSASVGATATTPARTSAAASARVAAAARAPAAALTPVTARVAVAVTSLATLAVVAVCTPVALQLRTPYAKNNSDWQTISALIGSHARPGDAVVFDESTVPWENPRLALRTYPAGFAGLRDVTLRVPFADADTWHDEAYSVEAALARRRFDGVKRVWLVEYAKSGKADDYGVAALEGAGFRVMESLRSHRSEVVELTR